MRAQAALFPRYLKYPPSGLSEELVRGGLGSQGACEGGERNWMAKEEKGKVQQYPSSSGRPSFSPPQVARRTPT